MLITFSGVDGSGKTTHAKLLSQAIRENGKNVRYVHMIEWSLVNKLGRFLSKLAGDNGESGSPGQKMKQFKPFVLLATFFDVLYFYIFEFYVVRLQGNVLICDRYFFDLGVQAAYRGIMGKNIERFYWRLVPRPDHCFLLDVDPHSSKSREGEHDISYYEEKRDMYLERVSYWGCDVIQDGEIKVIQREIMSRFPNLVGGNFVS